MFGGKVSTKTKFVILFYERSGSTLLTDLLNQHPEISCFPEVFYPDWPNKLPNKLPDPVIPKSKIHKNLTLIYDKPKQGITGFKFKYPIQYNIYPEVVNYLEQNKQELKVIFLYRINKLKGAISKQNHARLIQTSNESNLKSQSKIELGPLELNIPRAIKNIRDRQLADRKFYQLTEAFPHRLFVSYESLLNERDKTLKSIFSFLGADTNFKPKVGYKKNK